MNAITIDTIRNTRESDPKVIELLDQARKMTDEEKDLFLTIIELCAGRPDRKQYALGYTGRIKDLPAALVQI